MELELLSAANLLTFAILYRTRRRIGWCTAYKFRDCVVETLRRRYKNRWFPEKPFKGSGYRTIRINSRMHPDIAYAGELSGLSAEFLRKTIAELVIWINPNEVYCRIGENGRVRIIYPDKEGNYRAWSIPSLHKDSSEGEDLLVSMCREWYRAQGIEKEKIDIDDMAEYVSSPH